MMTAYYLDSSALMKRYAQERCNWQRRWKLTANELPVLVFVSTDKEN